MNATSMTGVKLSLLLIACGSSIVFGQQNYSNTTVNNTTGAPINLMDIVGSDGKTAASLYITGNATFGPNQVMVKGSGYIQALPGETVNLIAIYRFKNAGEDEVNYDEFGIKVNRVDWDEDGRTTHISGIDSLAKTDVHGSLKITSDLSSPTLTKDGAIVLEVEKLGKVTVDFRFGGLGGRQTGLGSRGAFVGDPVLVFNKSGVVFSRSGVSAKKPQVSIHDAARDGDLAGVKALLRSHPALSVSKDSDGTTPLYYAALKGHKDVAALLLASKAEVDAKNNDGVTPLCAAAKNGYKDVAELLLASKADANAKDNLGMTPLHWAASNGYYDVAILLLANKADVNAKDKSGVTPLHEAELAGQTEMVELLRQQGGHK